MQKWKICINNPFQNCDRIYPIQQERVKRLLDSILMTPGVSRVIVFGSSTTSRCRMESDVDIYVEGGCQKPKPVIYDFSYDLWTDMDVDERLYNEIVETGVVIYGNE